VLLKNLLDGVKRMAQPSDAVGERRLHWLDGLRDLKPVLVRFLCEVVSVPKRCEIGRRLLPDERTTHLLHQRHLPDLDTLVRVSQLVDVHLLRLSFVCCPNLKHVLDQREDVALDENVLLVNQSVVPETVALGDRHDQVALERIVLTFPLGDRDGCVVLL
jgi:hypothetical protein